MGRPRILLADDQPEILQNISRSINGEFEIVGAVQNGQDAIDAVASLDPDVLVLDITMPVLNGIEAASRLQESACRTKVIFITVHDDPDYVMAAFDVGAVGYVLKTRLTIDLIPSIREALQGRTFVSPCLRPFLSDKK